jgi:hypothetical protein
VRGPLPSPFAVAVRCVKRPGWCSPNSAGGDGSCWGAGGARLRAHTHAHAQDGVHGCTSKPSRGLSCEEGMSSRGDGNIKPSCLTLPAPLDLGARHAGRKHDTCTPQHHNQDPLITSARWVSHCKRRSRRRPGCAAKWPGKPRVTTMRWKSCNIPRPGAACGAGLTAAVPNARRAVRGLCALANTSHQANSMACCISPHQKGEQHEAALDAGDLAAREAREHLERSAERKVLARILPCMFLFSLINYIDRRGGEREAQAAARSPPSQPRAGRSGSTSRSDACQNGRRRCQSLSLLVTSLHARR